MPRADEKAPRKSAQTAPPLIVLSTLDRLTLLISTLLAACTRFYRIAYPPAVVFDELHFSKFIDRQLSAIWFFDIHPPLGKLILAYTAYALGYRPEPSFVIEKIGNPYPDHVKYYLIRYVSAAFSVATVPLTFLTCRALSISSLASIVPTAAVLLDFLGIIEGRLILMDSQLLFFCQLALLFALKLWTMPRKAPGRSFWLIATGLVSGAALSIKHTALATPGLIAIVSFFGLHFTDEPLPFLDCLAAGASGLAVYVSSFYVLFNTLFKTGGKYDRFMPKYFRKTLEGAAEYDPSAPKPSFLRLFVYMNRRMVASNASIKKRHTWESDWYHWIVNWRGVLYFLEKDTEAVPTLRTQIYLFGNPAVIFAVLAAMVIFLALLSLSIRYRAQLDKRASKNAVIYARSTGVFLLWGWLCNLLPYILVDRAAFIYHYLPGLFYGQLLLGVLSDTLPHRLKVVTVVTFVAVLTAAFVYWSPWIYAVPLTYRAHQKRRWLPKWT